MNIFFEKGLYSHCEKLLKKAKGIVIKYESFLPLLKLMTIETKIMQAQSYGNKTEKDIDILFDETDAIIAKVNNQKKYHRLLIKTNLLQRKTGFLSRSGSEIHAYENIIRNPL